MQYLKRLFLLFVLVGIVYFKVNYFPDFESTFGLYNVVGFILNILFVFIVILIVLVSKNIIRNTGIIIFDIIVLLTLLFFSFYVPIYYLGENIVTHHFAFIIDNLSVVHYSQLIFGVWLCSFMLILFNKRNLRTDYRRYMR